MDNNYLIIDGNSIMNRAFYAIKLLKTKDGICTNAVYGFLNIMSMLRTQLKPKYIAVAFDLSAPTFRHKMYNGYKANRHSMPDELRSQMPIIKEILTAMNITILEKEGYEADDILGTVALNNDKEKLSTYILTGDRDSLQLISDNTTVVIPHTQFGKTEYSFYDTKALYEKYQVEPNQIIDVKALMGDASDNIPGVNGIGEKKAYPIINKYKNIDNLYAHIENNDIDSDILKPATITALKEQKDMAYLSKQLATINKEVPLNSQEIKVVDCSKPNVAELLNIYEHLEFKKFYDKLLLENNDGNIDTTTLASRSFYESFNADSFIEVKNATQLEGYLANSKLIYFDYICLDDIITSLKDTLVIKDGDRYLYCMLTKENRMDILQFFCKLAVTKIGFNTKRMIKTAFDVGVDEINAFNQDVMLMYYVLNTSSLNYNLENISYTLLKQTLPKIDCKNTKYVQISLFEPMEKETIEITVDEKKYMFACLNSIEQCFKILQEQLEQSDELKYVYEQIEMPLVITLASMEHYGMYINKEKLLDFGNTLDVATSALEKDIFTLANDKQFNIRSPKQLGEMLFDTLQIPYPKKNKTNYSTDKEILEELSGKYEIVDKVLEYRRLTKLKSTYVDGLISEIKQDGRLHTTFMQALTATGRLSSIEPNLQNIPVKTELGGKIRECFEATKGNVLIDADYSQIELRILADISEDKNMIAAFNNNCDIHTITASQVFNVEPENVTKELRSRAKAVNFGIVYGISEYGLAKNIKSSNREAEEYINRYLKHYDGIAEYMKNVVEQGKTLGYVKTKFRQKKRGG